MPRDDLEPTLSRQNSMVADALEHVKQMADKDESLHWNNDPETDALRTQALAEMMGLRPESSGRQDLYRDTTLSRAKRSKDIVEAIRGCESFDCVKMAHERPRGNAKFNFPHFLIIGWQKTATTSLFAYLNQHPEISRSYEKEPEFFSDTCGYDVPGGCTISDTRDYITRTLRSTWYSGHDGRIAQYEASTHYSRNGHRMAAGVYEVFPWVKIVALMREPISRAASMLVHLVDKNVTGGGCLAENNMDMGHCLLTQSHVSGDQWGGPTEYYLPLKGWADAFPKEQIFLSQFEYLTSEEGEKAELVRLKKFLGVKPSLPVGEHANLGMNNSRRDRISPDGWPMKKEIYEQVVGIVRPDCEKVAQLVSEGGFGDGAAWMKRWEAVWKKNLDSCNEAGDCMIQLS